MITFLIRAAIFVVSAAIGLIAADLILEGFHIDWSNWWGFVLAVLIFAVIQSVLAPWVFTITRRHAPAMLGGIDHLDIRRDPDRRPDPAGGAIDFPTGRVVARARDRLGRHRARNLAAATALHQEAGAGAPRRLTLCMSHLRRSMSHIRSL